MAQGGRAIAENQPPESRLSLSFHGACSPPKHTHSSDDKCFDWIDGSTVKLSNVKDTCYSLLGGIPKWMGKAHQASTLHKKTGNQGMLGAGEPAGETRPSRFT